MCQQEESSVKGGILADEMGMGKTIQALLGRHHAQRLDIESLILMLL